MQFLLVSPGTVWKYVSVLIIYWSMPCELRNRKYLQFWQIALTCYYFAWRLFIELLDNYHSVSHTSEKILCFVMYHKIFYSANKMKVRSAAWLLYGFIWYLIMIHFAISDIDTWTIFWVCEASYMHHRRRPRKPHWSDGKHLIWSKQTKEWAAEWTRQVRQQLWWERDGQYFVLRPCIGHSLPLQMLLDLLSYSSSLD